MGRKMKEPTKTKFAKWILNTGFKEVSELLDVPPRTPYHWRGGFSTPRPTMMIKIKRLSKGEIDYVDMIEPYYSNKNKRK